MTTIGQQVIYYQGDDTSAPREHPAIITRVLDAKRATVNLIVFLDSKGAVPHVDVVHESDAVVTSDGRRAFWTEQ